MNVYRHIHANDKILQSKPVSQMDRFGFTDVSIHIHVERFEEQQAVAAAAAATVGTSVKNRLEIGEKLVQMEMNTLNYRVFIFLVIFSGLLLLMWVWMLPVLLVLLCYARSSLSSYFYSSLIDQYRTFFAQHNKLYIELLCHESKSLLLKAVFVCLYIYVYMQFSIIHSPDAIPIIGR